MKNKYKTLSILAIILSFILIGSGIFIFYNNDKQQNGTILYKLTYYDHSIPGSNSDINIYDNKVEIITTYFCSAVDCDSKTEKETFNYSQENINKLIKFINDNFASNNNNNIEIHDFELNDYQTLVMLSLLNGEYYSETIIEEYQ